MAEASRPKASKAASKAPAASRSVDKDKDGDAAADTVAAFKDAVNMTPAQLTRWLDTPESREVGFKGDSGKESVGHKSGRRIVRLLAKSSDDLTAGDLAHMRKVAGYVHRHLAQRPEGDIRETPWRYSLMNWGHDPSHAAGKKP